ncbi:MAG: TPM domain-containing protein [Christensenellaceae bacterium]|nr:TPM domain-containing protein [Christensenellaceae bacterium]
MKRVFCLLLAALLCLPTAIALAGPRYPDKQGAVTDAAAVLSASTVQDLRKLAEEFHDEDTAELYVATVDFLDGWTLSEYAAGLREKWWLGDNDLLLLMVVGEDKFGFFGGSYVNRKLSTSAQQKLLSTSFEAPFLRQDYDGAIAALMPALATEVGKAWNESIDISGLFGTVSASSLFTEHDWLVRPVEHVYNIERHVERFAESAIDTGFSLGKVILTVFLLLVIFGNRGKRRGREGCGCGCMPFSSLLAGWGLWKLWKK